MPRNERKRPQIERASSKSAHAKVLKLADKTSNLRAIAASPPADWSLKRRLEYTDWAKSVASGLRGNNPWLDEQFDRALAAARSAIAVGV